MNEPYRMTMQREAVLPNNVFFPTIAAATECYVERRPVSWCMSIYVMRRFVADNIIAANPY